MSPILVTLTSRSDSDFERSNVSLKENKPDGVNPNSNDIDYYVRKNEEWFSADCIFRKAVDAFLLIILICSILSDKILSLNDISKKYSNTIQQNPC